MIVVHCACGEVYQSNDDKAGYSIICTKCKRVIDLEVSGKRPIYVSRPKSKRLFVIVGALALTLSCFAGYCFSNLHLEQEHSIANEHSIATVEVKAQQKPLASRVYPDKVARIVPVQPVAHAYIATAEDYAEAQKETRAVAKSKRLEFVPLKLPEMKHVEESSPETTVSVPLLAEVDLSLPTGTDITIPIDVSGRSTLKIINGNGEDAVIKLVGDSDTLSSAIAYRYIYIKARDEFTVKSIPAGRYSLLYKIGNGWDNRASFALDEQSYRFGKPLEFTETTGDVGGGSSQTEWSVLTVTLHSVVTGTVRAQTIPNVDFNQPR